MRGKLGPAGMGFYRKIISIPRTEQEIDEGVLKETVTKRTRAENQEGIAEIP